MANSAINFPKSKNYSQTLSLIPHSLKYYPESNSSTKPGNLFFLKSVFPNLNQTLNLPSLKSIGALFCSKRKIQAPNSGFRAWEDHSPVYGFYFLFYPPAPLLPCSTHTGLLSVLPTHVLGQYWGQYCVFSVLDCSAPHQPNSWLILIITEVLTFMLHPVLKKPF